MLSCYVPVNQKEEKSEFNLTNNSSDVSISSSNQVQMFTRRSDIHLEQIFLKTALLPPVNWKAINQSAPTHLSIKERNPEDPLPPADIVILTWTSAEWFALDHIFLNSGTTGNFVVGKSSDVRSSAAKLSQEWFPYTRDASGYYVEKRLDEKLWGFFQMVQITDLSGRQWRVLLFKSSSHLAHAPWIEGLTKMLQCIIEDTKPDRVYTIGTSGGARLDQRLGDVVITNATLLNLQRPENTLDLDNGSMHRCPSWFPSTTLIGDVERSLLYNMNQIVTMDSLKNLLSQIKERHHDDPGINDLKLSDLLNDSIRPEFLDKSKVRVMKDVPLLTTDFFYVAKGDDSNAYSFLEMDDAIVAREANLAGIRFACIRNISDPIARDVTDNGTPISEKVQTDWSGLIYANFGLQSSYNSALVTWATIAGEGASTYDPLRSVDRTQDKDDDPLEIKLAFQVRSCGTCSFFWPKEKQNQPYGPYTAFDFDINTPFTTRNDNFESSRWIMGRTRPPSFPNGAIMGGCRKAPIMTIGVNPNLTAFLPGQNGAAWAYPSFSSDNGTDSWTKYAWYYRYRSVFQERLSLDFIRKFILPESRIIAPCNGYVKSATRLDDGPAWTVKVRYDGDDSDTIISLPGKLGDFPYVILFDTFPPHNNFTQGDVIAGRISVPEGIQVEVMRQKQNYYKQFVPVLEQLQDIIRLEHPKASLQMGEEVCQLDMVACASPHWRKEFLGGDEQSVDKIVDNCVSQNAWAIKQIVQTRPTIIYIVGESSWKMFLEAFGAHVQRDPPLSESPADKEYTLLRETIDPDHPCNIVFDVTVDGCRYTHKIRLVITPHFSYDSFFLPQFRLSPDKWNALKQTDASCIDALTKENGFKIVQPDPKHPDPNHPYDYVAVHLLGDKKKAETLDWLKQQFPSGYDALIPYYYDPHAMMASVLNEMYSSHVLSWKDREKGPGYLVRTEGSCQFCVNKYWQFPFECRYDKTDETPPPAGFLERVAEQIISTGKPHKPQVRNIGGELL